MIAYALRLMFNGVHNFLCMSCWCRIYIYRVGVQEGSERMLEMLEYIGIVTIDDDDNVYPNKSYVPTYRVKK